VKTNSTENALPAAGCRFELSAKTIQPLTKLLREELEKLGTGRKFAAYLHIRPRRHTSTTIISAHILYDLNPFIVSVINEDMCPINPIDWNFESESVLTFSIFVIVHIIRRFSFVWRKTLDILLKIIFDAWIKLFNLRTE
jgi:hypothetical protein